MNSFNLQSDFEPTGDQPKAIQKIIDSINTNNKFQTILGVTGSGKTYTMANIIYKLQRPTLIIAHNKTLAAQLCSEFKAFFPDSIVEYFVSYYDYYQPEAYVAATDTYIEKDSSINEEIDKLRHSATSALFERRDVIIVASVSCIYGLGDPEDYTDLMLSLRKGMIKDRDTVIKRLVDMQYTRNEIDFHRGTFRVRGDVLDIYPASSSGIIQRVEFFGDEIERISELDVLTGEIKKFRDHIAVFPASHFVTSNKKMERAIGDIKKELEEQIEYFKENNKLIEAQRIEQRTRYDIEMLREIGFCQGIENYSRYISGREVGSSPYTLIDYFPDDFLIFIDESHVTTSQIGAMYNGDRARKKSLIDFGFRLPSAYDNRPLKFSEFLEKAKQITFVSATPGNYEKENSLIIAEQIIRPTGLIDPEIIVKPIKNQVDDLMEEIRIAVKNNSKVLVTTLTKRMSEDLTDYLADNGIQVKYLHSDIDTLERIEIIRELRIGSFDVLVGINLLREGLDIPEVALVAILDADKEGFLRSETSLIQTIGRAARNIDGKVIMYADKITGSMDRAISETNRRRKIQVEYNKNNNIKPASIKKSIKDIMDSTRVNKDEAEYLGMNKKDIQADLENKQDIVEKLKRDMKQAATNLDFERAAELRDFITELEKESKYE